MALQAIRDQTIPPPVVMTSLACTRTDRQGGLESFGHVWARDGQGGWVRFAEHTRNGVIHLGQTTTATPLRTASHGDDGTRFTTPHSEVQKFWQKLLSSNFSSTHNDGTAPHCGDRPSAAGSATAAGAEVTVDDVNCSDDCPYTSHHGNYTEAAATAAAAADAGASADDGIDSEGRPEGRLSTWRPEAANDGIYSEGCPERHPSGWESEGRSGAPRWPGSGCPEAATAAADAGASAYDGIDSEDRPEGRLSAWAPEAADDGIYSEGCPEGRPSGWGPEDRSDALRCPDHGDGDDTVLGLSQRAIGDDAPHTFVSVTDANDSLGGALLQRGWICHGHGGKGDLIQTTDVCPALPAIFLQRPL